MPLRTQLRVDGVGDYLKDAGLGNDFAGIQQNIVHLRDNLLAFTAARD